MTTRPFMRPVTVTVPEPVAFAVVVGVVVGLGWLAIWGIT